MLKHCRTILSDKNQSQQYSKSKYLTTEVIFSPRRKKYARGGPEKWFEWFFSKKSHSAKNEIFTPVPMFIHCPTHSSRTQNRKNIGSGPELGPEKTLNFVSQWELSITSPESSGHQNRVLCHPSR